MVRRMVDTTPVEFTMRDVWLVVGVTCGARDVVSRTLNQTREFLAKEKPPTRLRKRRFL